MIIIYHSKDLDGYCSGAICKRKYPDATLIGYDYGQDFPWDKIPEGEPVIMVDVSLPMPEMERLANLSTNLLWIDHHVTSIEDYKIHFWGKDTSFIHPVLQVGIAACEIAWMHLFPNQLMPAAVALLGRYDTWRGADTPVWNEDILPFQYGMRLLVRSAEDFSMDLLDIAFNYKIVEIKSIGNTILEYQRQQFEIAMHASFECEFQGYRAIMCNIRGAGSLAFESVLKPEHQLMVGFGYTGSKWSFSLRTDKEDVDVSLIAKQFGGGGHLRASGFAINSIQEILPYIKCEVFTKSFV